MTESEESRVDLRALDEPPDPRRVDRVVGAAMARIAASPRPRASRREGDIWDDLAAWLRPGLAAAAVLAALAGGTLAAHGGREPVDGSPDAAADSARAPAPADLEAQVGEWLASRRAPTAGELLVAFRGYPR